MNVDLRVKSGRVPPRGKRRASSYRMALAWRQQPKVKSSRGGRHVPAQSQLTEPATPGTPRQSSGLVPGPFFLQRAALLRRLQFDRELRLRGDLRQAGYSEVLWLVLVLVRGGIRRGRS